jgi:hypothetical protein
VEQHTSIDVDAPAATLSITQSGWLGSVAGRVYRSLTDRHLAMEAPSLKVRVESPAWPAAPSPTPGEQAELVGIRPPYSSRRQHRVGVRSSDVARCEPGKP